MIWKTNELYTTLFFVAVGSVCIFLSLNHPIKDFGNYYYGSRLFLDGKFSTEMYTSIHYFNKQIGFYGETNFFENYIPVPPFSALFYTPLCFFKSLTAKFIFNFISLILFCFSLFRLLRFVEIRNRVVYFLPLVFIYPIYNNVSQGQTYLLVVALLIEGFLSSEKSRVFYPSLLFATVISLKLFPAFILIYFFIKRQYKIVFSTMGLTAALFAITYLLLPDNTTLYYFTNILPRLLNNDVVGPYYHGNQSVYTALLQFFSYDGLSNPKPVFNNIYMVVFLESLFYAFILASLFSLRKHTSFFGFTVVLFSTLLIGRYNASYGMIFLLPLSITFVKEVTKPLIIAVVLIGVVIAISLPVGELAQATFALRFGRLILLLLLFCIALVVFQLKPDFKLISFIFVPLFVFKYFSFSILPASYFKIQNSQGVLYDIKVKPDSITLISTLGENDFVETYTLSGKITMPANLSIANNIIYYNNREISASKDNKKNPFLYNDSLVFMSDLNQAVGFYKLRTIAIQQE